MTPSPALPTKDGWHWLFIVLPDGERLRQGIVYVGPSPNGYRVFRCGVDGSTALVDFAGRYEFSERLEEE